MANDLTRNPLLVDTAHATNVVLSGPCTLRAILWFNATGLLTAIVHDKAAARVVWERSSPLNSSSFFDVLDFDVGPGRELIVPTLGSGTLAFYLGAPR